jgi:hypothetical protein
MNDTGSGIEAVVALGSKQSLLKRLRHRRNVWAGGAALLIVLVTVGSAAGAATVAR